MKRSRRLLVDLLVIMLAASARVGIERAQGLVHAGDDLGAFFIPSFAWWWQRPRFDLPPPEDPERLQRLARDGSDLLFALETAAG